MATVTATGMTGNEKQVVGYTFMAHALNHGVELVYGAVLIVVALEFGASIALLGVVANVSALSYGLSAFPAGAIVDKVGSKSMVVLSMAGSGAAAALAAAAPNVGVLAAALVLMGVLGGIYHPAGLSLVTRGVRERTRGLGFHGMGGNLGTATAPILAAFVAGVWSWRASFLVFAVLALVVAVLVHFSRVEEPGASDGDPDRDAGLPGDTSTVRRTLLVPLILVFVINAFYGFIFRGTVTFLPLHMSRNLGLDILGFEPVIIGGSFATLALLLGILGQYVGGEIGERHRRELVIIPLAAATVPALLLVGTTNGVALIASACAFAFFNFMVQPSLNALIADYSVARVHGRAFGFTFLAGFGFGSFAGTSGGVIADEFGVEWVFVMLAGFGFLIFLTGLALYVIRRRQQFAA